MWIIDLICYWKSLSSEPSNGFWCLTVLILRRLVRVLRDGLIVVCVLSVSMSFVNFIAGSDSCVVSEGGWCGIWGVSRGVTLDRSACSIGGGVSAFALWGVVISAEPWCIKGKCTWTMGVDVCWWVVFFRDCASGGMMLVVAGQGVMESSTMASMTPCLMGMGVMAECGRWRLVCCWTGGQWRCLRLNGGVSTLGVSGSPCDGGVSVSSPPPPYPRSSSLDMAKTQVQQLDWLFSLNRRTRTIRGLSSPKSNCCRWTLPISWINGTFIYGYSAIPPSWNS